MKDTHSHRAKLAESDATVEQLRRQTGRSPRSPRMSTSMSMMSSITSSMGGFEAMASPDSMAGSLLDEAKRDLKKMKRQKKRSQSRTSAHG